MDVRYLKKSDAPKSVEDSETEAIVRGILAEIEAGGEAATRACAEKFDKWTGDIVVGRAAIDAATASLSDQVKDDIRYAHDNIRRFAEAQRETITDFEIELHPGLVAGQKQIPVGAAGCYVPGGRYSHVASAMMTVTTAKVAGVRHIAACSPPRPGEGVPAAILYTLDLCGADTILALGGVQGIAAMTFGHFGVKPADILVGPGNQFVAQAKRLLFGRVGIDMFAGPTDLLILADKTAEAETVAWDLVGQAEHGYNSPVWLATTDEGLAEAVLVRVPHLIDTLPELNAENARAAWATYGEVMLCPDREALAQVGDAYAPEHLHVQAADLDWWRERLTAYGSLFLGSNTTVAFGDKAAGPNHVLPTSGAARYTGGLSVHKYMKTVTWQMATAEAAAPLAEVTARISRLEGMEAHARTADIRTG